MTNRSVALPIRFWERAAASTSPQISATASSTGSGLNAALTPASRAWRAARVPGSAASATPARSSPQGDHGTTTTSHPEIRGFVAARQLRNVRVSYAPGAMSKNDVPALLRVDARPSQTHRPIDVLPARLQVDATPLPARLVSRKAQPLLSAKPSGAPATRRAPAPSPKGLDPINCCFSLPGSEAAA